MGYIGKKPATQGKDAGPSLKLDDISSNFDGNTTVFDLTVGGTVVDPHINNIQIYLSGVHQLPGTSYSLSGSQVVFTGAPSSSLNFHGSLIGDSRIITPDNNTVEPASFTSNTTDAVSGSWQGVIGSGSLGMVSGSSISTGSFGAVNIGGMSVSNLVDFSSSIASRITDEESDFTAAGISGSWQGVIGSGSLGMVSGSAISTGSFGTIQTTNGTIPTLIGDTTFSDDLTVGGNLDISDTIFHTGDSNTKIRFPEVDTISFHTSGDERLRITSTGAISGSAVSTGSFGRVIISEMGNSDLTDVSSSISTRVNLLEGSGSITESSASFSTRVNLLEGSGSITESSASFSTRVNLLEGSGSINDLVTDSGSFSTRVSDLKTDSGSFSTRVTTAEASGALFDGDGVVTFAGATITGTLTAQEVHTEFISASVTVSTGSNIFGDETTDVHQFTGSIETSGSILLDTLGGNVSGSIVSTGSFGAANIAGMTVSNLVDVSSSLSSRLTDVKTESGSFAAASSSYSSASGSFSTRVSDLKTDSGSFSTRVSDLKTDSGSFSTRVSDSNLYLSGSGTIISGSSVSTGSFGHIKLGTADIGGVHKISLSNNDAGTSNTIFGKDAGLSLDAGSNYNVFIGEDVSDAAMNDAVENVGVGYQALSGLTTGDRNTVIGYQAGIAVNTGTNNTIIGRTAGTTATTSSGSVFIGDGAGEGVSTGNRNIAIGQNAMVATTTGDNNVAIGAFAGDALTSGFSNVIIGKNAGGQITTAKQNVIIGEGAYASANTSENFGVAIGFNAATLLDGIDNVVAIGHSALSTMVAVDGNTAVGFEAGKVTTGANNTYLGFKAGKGASGAETGNVGFGTEALTAITTGANNNCIGYGAGKAIQGGASNIIIGKNAGDSAISANQNIIIGQDAGQALEDVDTCIIIGHDAGKSINNTAAAGAVAIGYTALGDLTSGARCTAVGYTSIYANSEGSDNTAVGYGSLAGVNHVDADHNTAIGVNGGSNIVSGYQNTHIGSNNQPSAAGAINQTTIGYAVTGVANNSVTLGNASVTAVYAGSDSGAVVHAAGMKFDNDQTNNIDEANTLDDYEEGTQAITVGMTSGTLSLVGGKNEGQYTKIGRMVYYSGEISCNGASSPSGTITFTLPFTVADITDLAERTVGTCSIQNCNYTDTFDTLHMNTYAGQNVMTITAVTDNGGWQNLNANTWVSSTEMVWSIAYIAA